LVRFKEALENSQVMREQLSDQYRYIMVDEYQDTNKLEDSNRELMTARHDNVAVVGDEFSSIYSFRGAVIATCSSSQNFFRRPKSSVGGELQEHAAHTLTWQLDHGRR
jgi:DNA helicase-2/ATP-dependent DNA helicase PcrA